MIYEQAFCIFFFIFFILFSYVYAYPYKLVKLDYEDPLPKYAEIIDNLETSEFINKKYHKNIKRNLLMLFNSFDIYSLPLPEMHNDDLSRCMKGYLYNQHSMEARFPYLFTKLTRIASQYFNNSSEKSETKLFYYSSYYALDKLNLTNPELVNQLVLIKNSTQLNQPSKEINQDLFNLLTQNENVYSTPLFKYLDFRYYSSCYCTRYGFKEYFLRSYNYSQEMQNYVLTPYVDPSDSSIINFYAQDGHDLLIPATHPFTYRTRISSKNKEFTRASFLHVDFDLSGNPKKDIIVPYYAKLENPKKKEKSKKENIQNHLYDIEKKNDLYFQDSINNSSLNYYPYSSTSSKYRYLFSFIGSERPLKGFRYTLQSSFNKYMKKPNVNENFFYTLSNIAYPSYLQIIRNSEFCLFLPGDSSSSSRIFLYFSLGCIPVVINDNLSLPYENYIDYSQTIIKIPQLVAKKLSFLFDTLKKITEDEKKLMRSNIKKLFESFLLYPDPMHSKISLLNPLSLALVEYIDKKLAFCESFNEKTIIKKSFCDLLLKRKSIADKFLPLID